MPGPLVASGQPVPHADGGHGMSMLRWPSSLFLRSPRRRDPMYGPAVRRKKIRRSGLRSCINVSGL